MTDAARARSRIGIGATARSTGAKARAEVLEPELGVVGRDVAVEELQEVPEPRPQPGCVRYGAYRENITALLHLGGVTMAEMHPASEPYDHGMLDVGDGNHVYWEACGNPEGKPVVVLHGGPGSGCRPSMTRTFDPRVYRIVLFDQRQCGRSTPHASDPATDLSVNTTEHLLADIERLRCHLDIERWMVFGGSWGSTLGLAYAERHPERVTEIILVAVTTTRRSEIDWLYHGVGMLFPEQWHRFREGVPAADRDADLVAAYHRLVGSPDAAVREKAVRDWCDWEEPLLSVDPDVPPPPYRSDPDWRMAFVRIVTHYFHHAAWLDEGVLLREAGKLAGIPGALVHGRLDLQSPLITAWELARAWPDAELVVVEGAGHSGHPGLGEALLAAAARFARPTGAARTSRRNNSVEVSEYGLRLAGASGARRAPTRGEPG